MTEEVVNAYWQGPHVVLLRRDESGELRERKVPAAFDFFVRTEDYRKSISVPLAGGSGQPRESTLEAECRKQRGIKSVAVEGDYVRIRCRDPNFRKAICRGQDERGSWMSAVGIEALEADLSPVRRYLADSGCEIQRPRKVWLDIETDSRVPFSKKLDARILCWALTTEDGTRVAGVLEEDTDEAERELLLDLFFECEGADAIVTWNGGVGFGAWDADIGFDFPVIGGRVRYHRIPIELRRWLCLDAMGCFRKYNMHSAESGDEKSSVALERVAENFGIDVSSKTSVRASRSWELWAAGGEDRAALVSRCVFDSSVMREIELRTGFVELHYSVCRTSGCFPDSKSLRALVHVEAFMLRLGSQRGVRFPSKWGQGDELKDKRGKFEGAFVLEPQIKGIVRDVHVCDFSGMYPSIIQSWNMSPETRCPELRGRAGESYEDVARRLPPGHCVAPKTLEVFRTDKPGILALAIGEAKSVRKKFNAIRDAAVPKSKEYIEADRLSQGGKISVNSFFGVVSSPYSRLFVREVGESITTTGGFLIKETMEFGSERGVRAIAGDTDSAFCIGIGETGFRQFKVDANRELYPRITEACRCAKNYLELDYEKEFEIVVFPGPKKRYVGRFKHSKGVRAKLETKAVIKGLEYVRGDSTRIARGLQKRVIDKLLLIGREIPDPYPWGPDDFSEMILEERTRVLSGELSERDIVISKSINKDLDDYEIKVKKNGEPFSQPVHVTIARMLEERGEDVSEGKKIEYVVIDGSSTPIRAVPASDYISGMEDREYLWLKGVWPATLRILEACWPSYRWAKYAELPGRGGGKGRSKYGPGQGHWDFFWDA